MDAQSGTASGKDADNYKNSGGFTRVPSISLPKGGGAIRGLGEKYAANPVIGTGLLKIPIAASSVRSGFELLISRPYDSGSCYGPFGLDCCMSLATIMRKTDKVLPRHIDTERSDNFIHYWPQVLVKETGCEWTHQTHLMKTVRSENYNVQGHISSVHRRVIRPDSTVEKPQ